MIAKTFSSRRAKDAVICGILCTLLLIGLAFLTQIDADAATVTASGTCGTNLTWELDDEGTLTISGSGEMTETPWKELDGYLGIKTVVIGDSVTEIVEEAFYFCLNLTSVTIGNDVARIGDYAFGECYKLVEVYDRSSLNITEGSHENGCVGRYALNIYTATSGKSKLLTDGKGYMFYKDGDDCYLIGYTGANTALILPDNCVGKKYGIYMLAFAGAETLTITIPNGVTFIGNWAFWFCSNLTSITIGNGVTSIGEAAFEYCDSLTEVNISDVAAWCEIIFESYDANPLHFAKHLYLNGRLVTELVIPEGVTCIEELAFYDCSSLTSITIGDSVTSIGSSAFAGCNSLTSITIGDSVTSIGSYAFARCSSLTSITIPNSVTSIGYGAFQDCSNLASVTMGDGVISIEGRAFGICSSLTSITIPDGVTSIGGYAFYYCSSLTSITIPNSVTSIGSSAFLDCSNLKLAFINSANIASDLTSSDACGGLANNATTIAIKSDITTIGSYITSNFTNVDTFIIDGVSYNVYSKHTHGADSTNWTVSENGDKVCSQCGLTVPADVAKTEGYCSKNVRWSFDEETGTLTISGKGAMKGYSATSMPWYAYASKIKKVVIGEGVTSIGKNAFNNEKAGFVFTEISLPSTLTAIGNYAFYGCTSLAKLNVPASINNIGKFAFRGTSLTNYTIGRCGKTADWMLDENGTLIIYGDGAMYDFGSKTAPWASYKDQIGSVVISEGVTKIGNCAFYECANIESVTLASTVTSIGNYSFYSCKALGAVGVPADVATIGIYAFRKCNALTSATFESDGWSYGDTAADIDANALKTNYKSAWTRA